tara:strand:- start:592 stop:1152 length:561 start_codon:yes stop_codon:yes gene_type:complete
MTEPTEGRRILGLDPGTRLCGWGLVDQQGRHVSHVDNGVWVLSARDPLAKRLGQLVEHLEALIETFRPHRVVVERAIYVHNVRTALALGQARGALVGTAARQGLCVDEVGPMQVKQAVTGRGRSSKAEVAEMVRRLLGLPEVAQEDASDALALAIALALGPPEGPQKKPKKGRKAWEDLAKKRGLI